MEDHAGMPGAGAAPSAAAAEAGTSWCAERRATINDVARAAGVSRQTVSNVVNRPDRVSPATLERVEAQIRRLGYRPSSAARSLRNQRAAAVGVEVDDRLAAAGDGIAFRFVCALSRAARRHGCHVVTFDPQGPGHGTAVYEAMVRGQHVDSFVLYGTHPGDPRPGWLAEQGIPFATFGRVWDDPGFTGWADVSGRAGTAEAVRHLVSRGYERIGYLGWPEGSPIADDRRLGWLETAEELGVLHAGLEASVDQHAGRAQVAATALVDRMRPGDALVCASDMLACGARSAVLLGGLRPGPDVGLVGFDGSVIARMLDLTTMDQPVDALAAHLLSLVDPAPGPEPESGGTGLLLDPTLVAAGSTSR